MITAAERLASPQADLHPYIRTARGQPASCRISPPPRCLPRVCSWRQAAAAVVFKYNYPSIGRILDEVRNAGGEVPTDFYPNEFNTISQDRSRIALRRRIALGQSISMAFTVRDLHVDMKIDTRAKRRYNRLREIEKAASKISSLLLEDNGQAQWAISPYYSSDVEDDLATLVDDIGRLREAAQHERKKLERQSLHVAGPMSQVAFPGTQNDTQPRTAADCFMLSLGATYKRYFADEPEIKQDSGREAKPGPFLAFVMATREEANEPTTPDTIRRAWDRARASQDKASKT